jgi:hypothetical protein
MATRTATHGEEHSISPIEHELTMHIERAHELSERAQRANTAVQHEMERARAIADELHHHVNAARIRR